MAYQQRGARREDLVAGLAFSIATNYLNRLVRERTIGDCIFFQGGTAYNDAVAAAFSQILGKEIIVPPHNGVIGALGMALLARERMQRTGEPSSFRGWDLAQVDYTVVDFVCKACSNECDVRQFTIEGEKTYWGDKCSDRYRKPAKVDKEPVIADLVAFRDELPPGALRGGRARVGESAPHGGPPAQHVHLRPAAVLGDVLRATGLPADAVAGERQADPRGRASTLTVAEPCFPIRVAHGHVQWLLREGVDYVFVPNSGQRRDRVRGVQLARLPLGSDAALRGAHRPGPGGAPRQVPRPARALPRRPRGPGARPRRHGRAARR